MSVLQCIIKKQKQKQKGKQQNK